MPGIEVTPQNIENIKKGLQQAKEQIVKKLEAFESLANATEDNFVLAVNGLAKVFADSTRVEIKGIEIQLSQLEEIQRRMDSNIIVPSISARIKE